MTEVLSISKDILATSGYVTERIQLHRREMLIYENGTSLGFLFSYPDTISLVADWSEDVAAAIERHKLALRRAGPKAWNTYVVLLASARSTNNDLILLNAIEEDLSGTRKIARSDIRETADIRAALLTLLPLQSAPRLDAVDIKAEIRSRTSELPSRSVNAFLSDADDTTILEILGAT